MLVRYVVLGLLMRQELHGYRVKSAFQEEVGPSWPLNFGQIYQALKDLKRRALVEAKWERSPQWRATEHSPGTFTAPA